MHVVAAVYIVLRVLSKGEGESGDNNNNSLPMASAVPMGNGSKATGNDDNNKSIRSFVQVIGMRSGDESGRTRLRKILCYDPLVALYLLVGGLWLGWLAYGMTTLATGGGDECENVGDAIVSSVTCGFLFVMLACCTMPCAFICLE